MYRPVMSPSSLLASKMVGLLNTKVAAAHKAGAHCWSQVLFCNETTLHNCTKQDTAVINSILSRTTRKGM
jgi:hypothetical protein